MEYTVAEFCAGTGAFSLGLARHNFTTIYANDIEPKCKVTFDANHPASLSIYVAKDVHDIKAEDIPAMDVMTFGFPCQPFSIAGRQEGFDDARSNVFWKLCEIIEHHKPKVIFAENVKNLTSHDGGNTFATIKKSLEDLGYHLKFKVLNTCTYSGIPQNRERIFIVGFKDQIAYEAFEFPSTPVAHAPIAQFLETGPVPAKYYYTNASKIWNVLSKGVKEKGKVYQYRRVYVRENKSGVCPTMTANMGTGGCNVPIIMGDEGIRKLTPRECFRLQGFPEDFVLPPSLADSTLYKQAGNAVTVKMIDLIGDKIYLALSKMNDHQQNTFCELLNQLDISPH